MLKSLALIGLVIAVIFAFKFLKGESQASQKALADGRDFLAKNKQREGIQTTDSGLQYLFLSQGDGGPTPSPNDTVEVHYHGSLIDGTVFDSSVNRGNSIQFGLQQVIRGWTEGLQLMAEGDKLRLFIPPELAYGKRAAGKIPPNSVLIFDIELIKINP